VPARIAGKQERPAAAQAVASRQKEETMKFTLEIELGNDAMMTGADVIKSLKNSLKDEEELPLDEGTAGMLWDENGNTVGKWSVSE
jgi:hypothetical protein